eukprot:Plantae.Rhodophyta-Hildenbrandia_rubra.ctg1423.p1 GENE.Plantae.Rhodophyta-Hildenbrandia_rubra.ctg1423~~Plantae.Rhodophyta-Hildenbrandia_rubra.ctg1423.p1  ORF type:complete len:373 (+),score=76.37 Plantae.Rhodophyta-Hildenbrandia_rubra.ctg1423:250-1368(+)
MVLSNLRIAFLGAGDVHFGAPDGPWNSSARLETLPKVIFSFIIDPNTQLAQRQLEKKRQEGFADKWKSTKILSSLDELLAQDPVPCDAVFIGVPPSCHGAIEPKELALEVRCAERGLHVFVEKPISLRPVKEVRMVEKRLKEAEQRHGVIIGVGYMLRYSMVVRRAKEIVDGHRVAAVIARYHCAYSLTDKLFWWDTRKSGGTIVEQGTHFADLMRYFGGDVMCESVNSVALSAAYPLKYAEDYEKGIPMKNRNDRATAASFLFESGAVGSLTHTALLHGNVFDTEVEVLADGLRVLIRNPYHDSPQLLVRRPGQTTYEEEAVAKKDMYLEEMSAFVNAACTGDRKGVLSPYDDAVKTYELTRWIADQKISR